MSTTRTCSSPSTCDTHSAGDDQQSVDQVMQQIPHILQSKHLKCLHHNTETAQKLHDTYGFFANGREMSHEVEQHLFDAFVEDDYDGHLHLMTLHSLVVAEEESGSGSCGVVVGSSGIDDEDIGPPLGIVFWRDVPDEEMNEWFDWNCLATTFGQDTSIENAQTRGIMQSAKRNEDSFEALGRDRTLHGVRQSSIDSIQKMVKDMYPSSSVDNTSVSVTGDDRTRQLDRRNKLLDVETLTHAWIKLELIAVRQKYWGNHLGSLLLSCTLYHAHYKSNQSRVILHVAGGDDNVPAVKLYERFGFHPVRQGTVFHKPNRYMYVLGDIARSLGGITLKGGVLETTGIHGDELVEG